MKAKQLLAAKERKRARTSSPEMSPSWSPLPGAAFSPSGSVSSVSPSIGATTLSRTEHRQTMDFSPPREKTTAVMVTGAGVVAPQMNPRDHNGDFLPGVIQVGTNSLSTGVPAVTSPVLGHSASVIAADPRETTAAALLSLAFPVDNPRSSAQPETSRSSCSSSAMEAAPVRTQMTSDTAEVQSRTGESLPHGLGCVAPRLDKLDSNRAVPSDTTGCQPEPINTTDSSSHNQNFRTDGILSNIGRAESDIPDQAENDVETHGEGRVAMHSVSPRSPGIESTSSGFFDSPGYGTCSELWSPTPELTN